jgi:hypothetical protein
LAIREFKFAALGSVREAGNFPGLGAGEFLLRLRTDDVSDLAGDGLARTGISNLAGLAELEGIVIGLSLGEEVLVVVTEFGAPPPIDGGRTRADDSGVVVILRPDGRFS